MAGYFSCKSLEFTIFEKQNNVLWTDNLTIFSCGLICFAEMKKRVLKRKTTNSLTCIPITIRSEN